MEYPFKRYTGREVKPVTFVAGRLYECVYSSCNGKLFTEGRIYLCCDAYGSLCLVDNEGDCCDINQLNYVFKDV